MAKKNKIVQVKPHEYSNPEMAQELFRAADIAVNAKKKLLGYAFVSFHEDGHYCAYCNAPQDKIAALDIPEMVKVRLLKELMKK